MHPFIRRLPKIQPLAVFESAARLGSFTEAARELGLTQPGVSRHVAGLERSIGLDLFHRSANRVRLTAAGESLSAATRAAFDTLEACVEGLHRAGPTFLIAADPGFAQQWLLPHVDSLRDALGDADLRLRLFDRDAELGDAAYDAAIHLTSVRDSPRSSRILFDEVVVPVAAPELAEAQRLGPISQPESLLTVEKLHLDGRDRQWLSWGDWFQAFGLSWSAAEARMSYNNYALVVNEAVAGRGVALAWRGLVDPLLENDTLVVVGPEVHNPDNAYQLIPGHSTPSNTFDRLVEWLIGLVA